jgi:FtsZ-interacting cell division protein ZipA
VFSVVAIVALSMVVGIGALVYRRRRRKKFDKEHVEAMANYRARILIDECDDVGFTLSRSNTNNSFYPSQKSTSEEMAPSSSAHMRSRTDHDELPIFLPAQLAQNTRQPEEYNPYRENPFNDRHATLSRFIRQPQDNTREPAEEHDDDTNSFSEESMYLEPPRLWPQMGQLPPAFGSPGSEIQLEFPRPALRVTNGLDDSIHA